MANDLFELAMKRQYGQANDSADPVLADLPLPEWRLTEHGAAAWEWIHTEQGGQAASDFIRLALYCKNKLSKKVGAKAIAEKLRWEYEYTRPAGQEFTINNNMVAYLVRFAEDRAPELLGYFEKRKVGKSHD